MEQYITNYHNGLNVKNKQVRRHLINLKRDRKSISSSEKRILDSDIKDCSKKIQKCSRLSSLEWNIYFFKSSLGIENNYPHTHLNVLFLPYEYYFSLKEHSRRKLLIHEQIHVYQRMFPIPFNHILINIHSLKVADRIESHPSFNNVRINPDLNNIIYKNSDNTYQIELLDDDASTLADSHTYTFDEFHKSKLETDIHEHHFEQLAYVLSDALYSENEEVVHKYIKYL